METNADPILITAGGMKNLPYRGWGEGGIVRISVIADQTCIKLAGCFPSKLLWFD